MIYQTLRKRLEEISRSLTEVESFPEQKFVYNDDPIHFQCICVFFVEFDIKENYKTQTFRIARTTKVIDIIEAGLKLWDSFEYIKEYRLHLLDTDTMRTLDENDTINALFKSNKSQMKSAKFLLAPRGCKINMSELEVEDEGSNAINVGQVINQNVKYYDFIKRFAGVAKFIQSKFAVLKEEELDQEKEPQKKKNKISLFSFILYIINTVFFFLFLIFSIFTVCKIKNPFMLYFDITILKSLLSGSSYLTGNDVIIDVLSKLDPFIMNKNENYKLLSMTRFSFYQAKEKQCDEDYVKKMNPEEKICYETFYKKEDAASVYDNEYIVNKEYENYLSNCDGKCSMYFYNKNESVLYSNDNADIVAMYKKYLEESVFKGFFLNNFDIDGVDISGDYGTYKGTRNVDIFLNINLINSDFINWILRQMNNAGYFDTGTLKAFIVDFSFYGLNSNYYYYVYLLYEQTGSSIVGTYKIIPFYPNLKEIQCGETIYVLDIIRVILVIVLFLVRLKTIYDLIIKNSELAKERKPSKSVVSIILSFNMLLDLAIFVIYISAFALKINFLYNKASSVEKFIPGVVNDTTASSFDSMGAMEYYDIAHNYEIVVMLECALIICLLLRLFGYFGEFTRFFNFTKYIQISLTKVIPSFIFFIAIILFFAVFAQILFGNYQKNFTEYSSALLSTIIFTIGHFQISSFSPSTTRERYQIVFVFLSFFLVIYYFVSSFFGTYQEAYRLNSLKHGNIYEMRAIRLLKKADENSKDVNMISEQNVLKE